MKKRYKTILLTLGLCGLIGALLVIGCGLENPYLASEQRAMITKRWGPVGSAAFDGASRVGAVGLIHYGQGQSLVHISSARLELLDRALQGQSRYLEVVKLQLAMQNLRGDFLETDLAAAQEEMTKFKNNDHNSRTPASALGNP